MLVPGITTVLPGFAGAVPCAKSTGAAKMTNRASFRIIATPFHLHRFDEGHDGKFSHTFPQDLIHSTKQGMPRESDQHSLLASDKSRVQAAGYGNIISSLDDGTAVGEERQLVGIAPEFEDEVVVFNRAM